MVIVVRSSQATVIVRSAERRDGQCRAWCAVLRPGARRASSAAASETGLVRSVLEDFEDFILPKRAGVQLHLCPQYTARVITTDVGGRECALTVD